ncbi:MAG: DUF1573 domain-containing protein [Candidatus Zixiibacteriota bacterium]
MFRKSLLLASLVILALSANLSAQPELTIPEKSFDFGFVPQNSQISHTFWLHSTGTDSLLITHVKPGCGCTKVPLDKTELGAKDSTALEVIFSTRTYRGKQSKRPAITTNAGPNPQMVEFSANVIDNPDETFPIKIAPYKFDISQFGETARTKLEFTITNMSQEDLALNLIDINRKMFKLDLPSGVKAGQSVKGTIEIKDGFQETEFEKSLTIQLNDTSNSRFTIPIKRTIRNLAEK